MEKRSRNSLIVIIIIIIIIIIITIKALKGVHVFHFKPTLLVWCGIGHYELISIRC